MRQVDEHVDTRVVRHTLLGQRESGSNLCGKRLTLPGNVFKFDSRKRFVCRDAFNCHSAQAHYGDAKENATDHWRILHGCGLLETCLITNRISAWRQTVLDLLPESAAAAAKLQYRNLSR